MPARSRPTTPPWPAATGCWRQGGADPAWLAGLEDSMARHAVAAAAARAPLVARLNATWRRARPAASPRPHGAG